MARSYILRRVYPLVHEQNEVVVQHADRWDFTFRWIFHQKPASYWGAPMYGTPIYSYDRPFYGTIQAGIFMPHFTSIMAYHVIYIYIHTRTHLGKRLEVPRKTQEPSVSLSV